ncbi:MAG: hypothetical protein EOS73_25495 [Mesorhizobium sp.]|uniref:hypothetical protein n=1 Tax=Mesorhizobium sp. M7A.F.Ca.ET.027.02.1.1 TaxID=2496655 RepID=UPI000FD29752|nr:hypothetical protein [Mesorhizobium sp. M7A.F.Ca.ET.027.02.1.1]RVD13555.1 hypothetical protein EN749_23055 [Mesorhizobium sp. M7A.F.Ca.ET.027.02.1.1]RWD00509.1 MAG: hypothetical protein EOS73_25495 [Mesorhizobium sp.]
MTDIMNWKVLRRHEGDRMYEEGETRAGTKAELGHLAPKVLELIGPVDAVKAEPAPLNKAERGAPANKGNAKAATRRK